MLRFTPPTGFPFFFSFPPVPNLEEERQRINWKRGEKRKIGISRTGKNLTEWKQTFWLTFEKAYFLLYKTFQTCVQTYYDRQITMFMGKSCRSLNAPVPTHLRIAVRGPNFAEDASSHDSTYVSHPSEQKNMNCVSPLDSISISVGDFTCFF